MGSLFSDIYGYINRIVSLASIRKWIFSGNFRREVSGNGSRRDLSGGFGEDVHAVDLGRHPKLRALFFDPHNRGLAAHPAFLAGREFWGKNQHQFDVGALLHAGLGVEENSVGTDIASLRLLIDAMRGAQARGNASGDSCSGSALGGSLHAGKVPTYCTPIPRVRRG